MGHDREECHGTAVAWRGLKSGGWCAFFLRMNVRYLPTGHSPDNNKNRPGREGYGNAAKQINVSIRTYGDKRISTLFPGKVGCAICQL